MKDIFRKTETEKGFLPVEKIALGYNALTTVVILICYQTIDRSGEMIWERFLILLGILALMGVHRLYPCRFTVFTRVIYQMALLSYWYPDTFEFNRYLPNLDHLFASAEQWIFGTQPAFWLGRYFPQLWISEPLNLGYVSYFPMIAVVGIWYFLYRYEWFQKWAFVLAGSFFLYYLIFIVIPVAGPQFYFPVIGEENVIHGIFPSLGDYFNTHSELVVEPDYEHGFFYSLVEGSHEVGERPTAAFPSSHVGISTILMCMAYRVSKRLFGFLLPFYLLMCVATVYIQAHYVIDAIAGFITAFFIYSLFSWIYRRLYAKNPASQIS